MPIIKTQRYTDHLAVCELRKASVGKVDDGQSSVVGEVVDQFVEAAVPIVLAGFGRWPTPHP
jgi:hypothetical protein